MQIKRINLIIVCVLCGLLCFLSFLLVENTKNIASLRKKYQLQCVNDDTFEKVLSRNLKAVICSDGEQLNQHSYLWTIQKNRKDSCLCEELAGELVLFVPKLSCNVCYDEIYDALKYAKDSLNQEIIIVTEKEKYNEVRNIILGLGINNSNNIYYLKNDIFWNSIAIVYAPFLAFVNNELTCMHSFIPIPNHSNYSYEYIKNLYEKYRFNK